MGILVEFEVGKVGVGGKRGGGGEGENGDAMAV